jgi:hypothetical protein
MFCDEKWHDPSLPLFFSLVPQWDSNIPREIVQPPRKNLGHPPAHAKNKKPQPEFEASDWGLKVLSLSKR